MPSHSPPARSYPLSFEASALADTSTCSACRSGNSYSGGTSGNRGENRFKHNLEVSDVHKLTFFKCMQSQKEVFSSHPAESSSFAAVQVFPLSFNSPGHSARNDTTIKLIHPCLMHTNSRSLSRACSSGRICKREALVFIHTPQKMQNWQNRRRVVI